MAVEYIVDTVEDIPYTPPRYELIYFTDPHTGLKYPVKSRLKDFTEKKTGRRFVDGEYQGNWVQYL